VASSEALDVLHQEMCPVSYHCIAMKIEIASLLHFSLFFRIHCCPPP
jgi:hypothetical protein